MKVEFCIMSSVADFLEYFWLWPLILRSYPYSETFVVIFTWYAIIVANMNMQGQKIERGVCVFGHRQVLSISDLDLWLPDHISGFEPLFHSTHYEQSLYNLEAMLYLKSQMHV